MLACIICNVHGHACMLCGTHTQFATACTCLPPPPSITALTSGLLWSNVAPPSSLRASCQQLQSKYMHMRQYCMHAHHGHVCDLIDTTPSIHSANSSAEGALKCATLSEARVQPTASWHARFAADPQTLMSHSMGPIHIALNIVSIQNKLIAQRNSSTRRVTQHMYLSYSIPAIGAAGSLESVSPAYGLATPENHALVRSHPLSLSLAPLRPLSVFTFQCQPPPYWVGLSFTSFATNPRVRAFAVSRVSHASHSQRFVLSRPIAEQTPSAQHTHTHTDSYRS